jgi:hypothetical protein
VKGGISRRQRRCLHFGVLLGRVFVILVGLSFSFSLTGRARGTMKWIETSYHRLGCDKKDAPPGLDAGCVNHMGESLNDLYERNPCC